MINDGHRRVVVVKVFPIHTLSICVYIERLMGMVFIFVATNNNIENISVNSKQNEYIDYGK